MWSMNVISSILSKNYEIRTSEQLYNVACKYMIVLISMSNKKRYIIFLINNNIRHYVYEEDNNITGASTCVKDSQL